MPSLYALQSKVQCGSAILIFRKGAAIVRGINRLNDSGMGKTVSFLRKSDWRPILSILCKPLMANELSLKNFSQKNVWIFGM